MRSRFLEPKEVAKIRRYMGAQWLPFQVSLETGLRVGDVAKITWPDISGQVLSYVAQKTGKPGKARLLPATLKALQAAKSAPHWVFPAPRDHTRHISRQLLWKRLKSACLAVGVPADGASPHSFRKVFAVREYREHGATAARAALQHSDLATTELYTLSDWTTGENAEKPLLRADLARILRYLEEHIFAKSLDFLRKKGKKVHEK